MRYFLAVCLAGCVAGSSMAEEGFARLRVVLPSNAELWVNNFKSSQTGSERTIRIDDLAEGYEYPYTVYARAYYDGQPWVISHTVWVSPGYEHSVRLDFNQATLEEGYSDNSSSAYNYSPNYSYGSNGYSSPGYSGSSSAYSYGGNSSGYSYGGFAASRGGASIGSGGGTGHGYSFMNRNGMATHVGPNGSRTNFYPSHSGSSGGRMGRHR